MPASTLEASIDNVPVSELQGGHTYWRALYYFNLYRLLLATGMFTVAVTGSQFGLLGRAYPDLFAAASIAMLVLAATTLISITVGWPAFRIQAYYQFSLDAVLITLMSYASGGIESGLNLLLIASVAAGGIVLSGRMSLFFAAFATTLALGEQAVEMLLAPTAESGFDFVRVGLLGIGYFSTGWIVYWLAQGFHTMEAAAQAREATTARLDRLNEVIVSKSTVGIVVVSNHSRYRLLNDQARRMLGLSAGTDIPTPDLLDRALKEASGHDVFTFDYRSPVTRVRVQGLRIERGQEEYALFLQDVAEMEREARNLKLAALGRLTASLAHEIRNPLEAISHAGQLLAESPDLGEQGRKLTGIIENQSNRINSIIKSVLQLGKPGSVSRLELDMKPWLERFCEGFNSAHGLQHAARAECGNIRGCVDPDQLNQILTNLCENALRYTKHLNERPLITLRCFPDRRLDAVCLDVLDRGNGVPVEIRHQIFEPFFTTNHYGLGLGLFLARELAQNNNAELEYVFEDSVGRFRLTLEGEAGAPARPMVNHG